MSLFFPHCCKITPTMLASAQAEAARIGVLRNSIRGGKGNLVGCLGEQAFLQLVRGSVSDNTFQHDVRLGDMTFECKTKDRTGPPKASYDASVASYNTTQQADYYAFFSAERIKDTDIYINVYFCGYISTKEYYEKSREVKKGDYDASNDWYARADCHSLHYSELDRCL